MNKEELQLIASSLRFELGKPELAEAIENKTHFFVDSPAAKRLFSAVLRGDWTTAVRLVPGVVASAHEDEAIFEIESCRVVETLIAKGGVAAMLSARAHARPEHAARLGMLLFNPPKEAPDMRRQLHARLRRLLDPRHTVPPGRLAQLLAAALEFVHLEASGHANEWPADQMRWSPDDALQAYVSEAVLTLSLEQASPLSQLATLCSGRMEVNIFGIQSVNTKLREIVVGALAEDPHAAVKLMQERKAPANDRLGRIFVSVLAATGEDINKGADVMFNALERYEHHRTPDLPAVDSVLQLGQLMEAVMSRFSIRAPSQSLFIPVKDQPADFPCRIVKRIPLHEQVWVVAFNNDGSLLATGCANGLVSLFRITDDPLSITTESSTELSGGISRIAWHPTDSNRLLIEDIDGFLVLWDVKKKAATKMFSPPGEPEREACSSGNVCWHPSNPDLFFHVQWNSQTVSLRHVNGKDTVWWYTLDKYLQAVTTTANGKLAVLTAVTDGVRQRIFVLDNFENPTSAEVYSLPADSPGGFSSLQCSQWDPRTLLLKGPRQDILLLDIEGERDTIILRGPLQNDNIVRPLFAGPMDKYVLCDSEEKSPPGAWVFNRFTGATVARFHDHRDVVNSIALRIGSSPKSVPLLATGSDDEDVLIYAPHHEPITH